MTKPPPSKTGSPGPEAPRSRQPTSVEKDLWQQVTDDVKPLADVEPLADYVPSAGAPDVDDAPDDPAETAPKKRSAPKGPEAPPPFRPVDPELTHGSAPGLDRRTQTRMRRGQVKIEARIDLHGLNQDEAYGRLQAFLHASRDAGRRAYLIHWVFRGHNT